MTPEQEMGEVLDKVVEHTITQQDWEAAQRERVKQAKKNAKTELRMAKLAAHRKNRKVKRRAKRKAQHKNRI